MLLARGPMAAKQLAKYREDRNRTRNEFYRSEGYKDKLPRRAIP